MSLYYWNRDYAAWLFQFANAYIQNEYGTAGLLGNIYAESAICPFRQQGDNDAPYNASWDLTVNNFRIGSKDNFVYYDGNTGYSLAQWTTYSRRENYYDYMGGSQYIGDNIKSAQFLIYELQNGYPGVYSHLQSATSIESASDYVLVHYEAPEKYNYETRREYSRQVYNDFSGLPPVPPISDIPFWLLKKLYNNNHNILY